MTYRFRYPLSCGGSWQFVRFQGFFTGDKAAWPLKWVFSGCFFPAEFPCSALGLGRDGAEGCAKQAGAQVALRRHPASHALKRRHVEHGCHPPLHPSPTCRPLAKRRWDVTFLGKIEYEAKEGEEISGVTVHRQGQGARGWGAGRVGGHAWWVRVGWGWGGRVGGW